MTQRLKPVMIWSVILSMFITLGAYDWNRDRDQQPEKVMDIIGVRRGMVIGEIGAGKGYFAYKMAKRVGPNGTIYANEINRSHLEHIRRECRKKNISNIRTVLGIVDDPLFTEEKLDMAFMCYVLHDLTKPVTLLQNLKKYLKPNATLVVMDQEPGKTGSYHFLEKEKLIKLVQDAGYQLIQTETFLVKDNFYIFRIKDYS